ncbi:MAG: uracil-DNA glycosylase [Legionellaceae bacterium]|nr:uracil-DNA glycosylase [Legionellaceae bacterium]
MHNWLEHTHNEWHNILTQALAMMDEIYLTNLTKTTDWLPGLDAVFKAFTQPLSHVQYILLGESPYPRAQSANGYAFWDASVGDLWCETGLSKAVNRATSLRNLLKMLLHARGDLTASFSQDAIADIDKSALCQTGTQLFEHFIQQGYLLLNASLVYRPKEVLFHAKQWRPFITSVLTQLLHQKPDITMILLGKVAANIPVAFEFDYIKAEHPYNLTFITNPDILAFFKPQDLLAAP